MPHIHTKPGQHDFTASAMIVRTDEAEPRVLMLNHKKYQAYMQPGGHVELDENPYQCILRELREEVGYEESQLTLMQPIDAITNTIGETVILPQPVLNNVHSVGGGHFHIDSIYLFTTTELPLHLPGEGESTDIIWVTQNEMNQLSDDNVLADTRDLFNQVLDSHLKTWIPIEPTSRG